MSEQSQRPKLLSKVRLYSPHIWQRRSKAELRSAQSLERAEAHFSKAYFTDTIIDIWLINIILYTGGSLTYAYFNSRDIKCYTEGSERAVLSP